MDICSLRDPGQNFVGALEPQPLQLRAAFSYSEVTRPMKSVEVAILSSINASLLDGNFHSPRLCFRDPSYCAVSKALHDVDGKMLHQNGKPMTFTLEYVVHQYLNPHHSLPFEIHTQSKV
jgi:hypothetical protein